MSLNRRNEFPSFLRNYAISAASRAAHRYGGDLGAQMGGAFYDHISGTASRAMERVQRNRQRENYRGAAQRVGKAAGVAATKHTVSKLKEKLAPGKRKILPASQSDSPATTNMATSGGEVPVIPPPRKIAKIHPDYFTIRLPYVKRFASNVTLSDFDFESGSSLFTIRLNSIYDPLKQTNSVAGPQNDSDAQPQGRDIWAANFKFYRVLSADVTVRIVSTLPELSTDPPLQNHLAYGYELVDEDHTLSATADMFMMTKRASHKLLPPAMATVAGNGTSTVTRCAKSSIGSINYHYDPNSWTYHVEEQGSEERWTPILQNPAIDHDMAVRAMHLNNNASVSGGFVSVIVFIEYTVQFREAIDAHFKISDATSATYGGAGEDAADD